jgi:hypothetical protein
MAFPVTIDVPHIFNWPMLSQQFQGVLDTMHVRGGGDIILAEYAYLLQITSWSHDVDWDVRTGTLTLELPFSGRLEAMDTTVDQRDYNNNVHRDPIAALLIQIIEEVKPERVLSHFSQERKIK